MVVVVFYLVYGFPPSHPVFDYILGKFSFRRDSWVATEMVGVLDQSTITALSSKIQSFSGLEYPPNLEVFKEKLCI